MESLGYYSTDTQIKAKLDTKMTSEDKIKEAYSLLLGPNGEYQPVI
jgi:hypothetical protein